MPTKLFDYKCKDCEHVFEYLSHGEEEEIAQCPECDSLNTETTLSTPLVTKLHDPKAKKAALLQRSADDSLKQVRSHAGHKGTLPKNFGSKRMY